jgi:gliding motility-associated-like protein
MNRFLFLFILFFLFYNPIFSQLNYYSVTSSSFNTATGYCDTTVIMEHRQYCVPNKFDPYKRYKFYNEGVTHIYVVNDIAIHPNGTMYGIASYDPPSNLKWKIVRFDFVTKTIEDVFLMPYNESQSIRGLVCDADGVLWAASDRLLSYNTQTGIYIEHGLFPSNTYCDGDLTFSRGKLVMTARNSPQPPGLPRFIAEINQITPILSNNIAPIIMPNSGDQIDWPQSIRPDLFVNMGSSCNDLIVIAGRLNIAFSNVDTLLMDGVRFYFDIANDPYLDPLGCVTIDSINFYVPTSSTIDNFDLTNSSDLNPGQLVGGAAPNEWQNSLPVDCAVRLDLDGDNSSGATARDFRTNICGTQPGPVADSDLEVHAPSYRIDSMQVVLYNPKPSETLTATPQPGITITQPEPGVLVFYNSSGVATDSMFELVLASVRYANSSPSSTPAVRLVEVRMYASGGQPFQAALTTLTLTAGISAGADRNISTCASLIPNSLYQLLNPGVSTNGTWLPQSTYDPAITSYQYVLALPGCPADTALFTINGQVGINDTITLSTCDPSAVGSTIENLFTAAGCDSTVTTITVFDSSLVQNTTLNRTTCDSSQIGTIVQNLQSAEGCDSVVTTVTVFDPSLLQNTTLNRVTCDSSQIGTTVQNLQSAAGCDSVVTTVTVFDPSLLQNTTLNRVTCDSSQIGTIVQNLQSAAGCDSVVTTVTVFDPSLLQNTTLNRVTCDSTQIGTVVQNLQSAAGCDSVVTTVTVFDPSLLQNTTLNRVTCDSTQIGTVVQNLQSAAGCDSVVTTVTVFDPTLLQNTTLNRVTCDSSQIGTTVQNLQSAAGCDSVVTTVTVFDPSLLQNTTLNRVTCDSTQVGTTVQNLQSALGCDSVVTTVTVFDPSLLQNTTLNRVTCDSSQIGTVVQNLQSAAGCDSVVTTVTVFDPSLLQNTTLNRVTCDSTQVGTTVQNLQSALGCDSVVTTVTVFDPTLLQNTTLNRTTCDSSQIGTTVQNLQSALGCDSVVTTITVFDPNPNDTLIIQSLTCDVALLDTLVERLVSSDGCDSVVITRTVLGPNCRKFEWFSPNIFSPNGDGDNDFWGIYIANPIVTQLDWVEVFDRWGNQLGYWPNLNLVAAQQLWDGTYNNQPMQPGVYLFQARVRLADGSTEVLSGDVTVLR